MKTLEPGEPTMGNLLETIKESKTLRDCTAAMKTRVSSLKDTVNPLHNAMPTVNQHIQVLMDKTEDLGNRLRRSNFQIVGLPKKVEGQHSEAFIMKYLQDVLVAECRSGRLPLHAAPYYTYHNNDFL